MKEVKYYSDEFKKGVVKEVILGEISQAGAMRKYGIGGSMTLPRWISKYSSMIPEDSQPSSGAEKSREELEREVALLRRQLEYEKLKREALDTMIKIAEEELKVPIRKKPGAKQSKK